MRIRLIKAHLTQITLCGGVIYMVIFLMSRSKGPEPSIAKRYSADVRKFESQGQTKQRSKGLTFDKFRSQNEATGTSDFGNGKDEKIIGDISSQFGHNQIFADNKKPRTIEAMKTLMQNLKGVSTNNDKNIPVALRQLLSRALRQPTSSDTQTSSSLYSDFDGDSNKILTMLLNAFPTLKGNIPAQDIIMQKLMAPSPKLLDTLKLLRMRSKVPKNLQDTPSEDLIRLLDNHHKASESQNNFHQTATGTYDTDSNTVAKARNSQNIYSDVIEPLIQSTEPSTTDIETTKDTPISYLNSDLDNGNISELQSKDFELYERGGINVHELIMFRNLLKNGITLQEIKEKYHLDSPQIVGWNLSSGNVGGKDKSNDLIYHAIDDDQSNPDMDVNPSKEKLSRNMDTLNFPDDRSIPEGGEVRKSYALEVHSDNRRRDVTGEATMKSNPGSSTGKDFLYMSSQEYDGLIEARREGVTKIPDLDFSKIRIAVVESDPTGMVENVTKLLNVEQYRKWKAERFIKTFANPALKSMISPTLMPYGDYIARPNPLSVITDVTMTVQHAEIQKALMEDKKRRLALGDDDLLQIPEVKLEMSMNPNTITNIIHFIWFSCRQYKVHHFMSMKSALQIHSPRVILLHTDCVPEGPFFEEFKQTAGSRLRVVKRTPPVSVWGNNVEKVEHRSDVARLQVLLEVGGIYMDDDVLVLKPLYPLMNNSIVLGEETYDALANSIVLANRDSWFLKRWYQEYKTFNDSKWSHSSCFVPWSLWKIFPESIHVVKEKMLRPNWEELSYIYHELWDWTSNYAMHLYSRFMYALDGTSERTLRELAILNTTYGEVSRYILWGDPKPRDITDWM